MGLVCMCYADTPMGSLGAVFRRRLRDLLESHHRPAGKLAKHLDVDPGRLSKILKYDSEAATVKLERLEAIAEFFGESPANLIRIADDEPMVLSEVERELLALIRLLPDEQKGLLARWLEFVFPERHKASTERAMMRSLNLHRQHEREKEHEELQSLRKQVRGK